MSALDGCIELQFALGPVAVSTLFVIELRQIDMVRSSGKIHVVVAGPASFFAGLSQPGIGLRSPGIWIVAGLAAPHIGGLND
jgi:hypothetical protein